MSSPRRINAPSALSDHANSSRAGKTRREATVYDAIAGRVASVGFVPRAPYASLHRDRPSSTSVSVPPEDVLFRRRKAPTRVAESDIYFASDQLKPDTLPDPDLLKTAHAYSSDFYARATDTRGRGDWRSMDETALLAVGILLEEASRAVIGETGDLIFVENVELSSTRDIGFVGTSVMATTEYHIRSGNTRRGRKRRRVETRVERDGEGEGEGG